MSSFICSPRHFNSVEHTLLNMKNDNTYNYMMREYDTEYISSVVDNLRYINVVCVTLQYKAHYKGKLDNEIQKQLDYLFNNKNGGEFLSIKQLLQCLRCINYQIEIEHLTELRELTESEQNAIEFLSIFSNKLAMYIINDTDILRDTKWSLD